jgi:hypothetical protein
MQSRYLKCPHHGRHCNAGATVIAMEEAAISELGTKSVHVADHEIAHAVL